MAQWKLLDDATAKENWDNYLSKFDDCSPFQTYDWGLYQQSLGWQPYHFVAENAAGEVCAMMLGGLRRYPFGTGLMWSPGGPIGAFEAWDESLPQAVIESTNLKRLYMRFRCDQERQPSRVLFLNHRQWNRSLYTITSNVSMELDLSMSSEALHSQMARNWRRNLKAADANELTVRRWTNPDFEELYRVYAKMEQRKNLPPQFSKEKLENILKYLNDNLILYRCDDSAGNLLCFRGCLKIGSRAVDYLAATTEKGLAARASYPTLWTLLQTVKEHGVKYYDLGGIDPWENAGVYKFKKETGAREVEYLGEWDWANSSWLRLLGNYAIWKKQNLRNKRPFDFKFLQSLKGFSKAETLPAMKSEPQMSSQ